MHVVRSNVRSQGQPPVASLSADAESDREPPPAKLSRREVECLQGLARGLHDAQIAADLKLSHSTVRLHLKNARAKLSAKTREQALIKAFALGLIQI